MDFILDPSLVLYLPLYELDGASLMSKDKHGHLATVTGALWTPQGRSVDGADDWIIISDTPFGFERTDPFALEIWLKTSSSDATSIFGKQANASPYNGYAIDLRIDGRIILNLINNAVTSVYTQVRSTTIVNNGAWHHLLCQNLALAGGDASDIQIYIDGALETMVTVANTLGANSILNNVNLRIGSRDGGGQPFNGSVGEARIYHRILTNVEIQRNYLATKWRYQ